MGPDNNLNDAVSARASNPAAAQLPEVPAQWDGPFDLYKYSKQAVKYNLGTIVILMLVSLVIGGISRAKLHSTHGTGDVISFEAGDFLISLIVNSLIVGGTISTVLNGVRKKKVSIGEALSKGLSYWLKMIGITLLVSITYLISLVLLIIPFFFVYPRLTLASYFIVDKDMGVIEAYKASWNITRDNAVKPWGITGVTVLIALLCVTIIGIPFAIYFYVMYHAAYGVLYEMLTRESSDSPTAAQTPLNPTVTAPPVQL